MATSWSSSRAAAWWRRITTADGRLAARAVARARGGAGVRRGRADRAGRRAARVLAGVLRAVVLDRVAGPRAVPGARGRRAAGCAAAAGRGGGDRRGGGRD